MSTRRGLWQLLWEVGTARRLSWLMLSRGQGPIWQGMYDRYIWDEFNESEKRAIRDYMNDLDMIVFVILEDLGLPELAVKKLCCFMVMSIRKKLRVIRIWFGMRSGWIRGIRNRKLKLRSGIGWNGFVKQQKRGCFMCITK